VVTEAQLDAFQFKFLNAPLTDPQLKEAIQLPLAPKQDATGRHR
jgi:hypothetical protein